MDLPIFRIPPAVLGHGCHVVVRADLIKEGFRDTRVVSAYLRICSMTGKPMAQAEENQNFLEVAGEEVLQQLTQYQQP
jgi:hypothetical protein